MFGHHFGKIIRKLALWFPPPPGHEDEGYLFMPEGKTSPGATARTLAPAKAESGRAAAVAGRTVLPAHNVLLIGASGSREIGLALRESGMKVTSEDDMLRAEKLMRRATFDAIIADMEIGERGLLSLMRILRRSGSKKAFFILLAATAGVAEHEIADRIGADAVWPKAGLQTSIVSNLEAVNAERKERT